MKFLLFFTFILLILSEEWNEINLNDKNNYNIQNIIVHKDIIYLIVQPNDNNAKIMSINQAKLSEINNPNDLITIPHIFNGLSSVYYYYY